MSFVKPTLCRRREQPVLLTRRARPLSDSLLPLLTQILLLAFLASFAVTLRRFHTIATMDVEEPSINLVRCGRVLECCVCVCERERERQQTKSAGVWCFAYDTSFASSGGVAPASPRSFVPFDHCMADTPSFSFFRLLPPFYYYYYCSSAARETRSRSRWPWPKCRNWSRP